MFATRTSRPLALIALALAGSHLVLPSPDGEGGNSGVFNLPRLTSSAHAKGPAVASAPKQALEQAMGAYKRGDYDAAVTAFQLVAARGDAYQRFLSEFYLGRIYADTAGPKTDHALAYMLLRRLADEHADVDPDDLQRAPYVAKALATVAIYVRDGLPEIALKPNPELGFEWLRHAATFFNEPDAQFEVAREDIRSDAQRKTGLHFLQKLVKEGHPGAQAVMSELLSRGRYVTANPGEALALVTMAVENASPSDRIWIEDIYQQIYCASPADVRERATAVSMSWRRSFARPRSPIEQPMALGRRDDMTAARVCSNGERLDLARPASTPTSANGLPVTPPTALGIMPSGMAVPPSAGKGPSR